MQKRMTKKPYEKSRIRQIELRPEITLANSKQSSGSNTNKCNCTTNRLLGS